MKKHFELWQEQQVMKAGKKPVIPESLWRDAIALIKEFSISRVAAELRLNQARLRLKVIFTCSRCNSPFEFDSLPQHPAGEVDSRKSRSWLVAIMLVLD